MSSDVAFPAAHSPASMTHEAPRVICVSHLGKQYQLGARARYRTLREALVESVMGAARLIGRSGSRRAPERFWALDDVSFDVAQGDVVGII